MVGDVDYILNVIGGERGSNGCDGGGRWWWRKVMVVEGVVLMGMILMVVEGDGYDCGGDDNVATVTVDISSWVTRALILLLFLISYL